MGRRWRETYPGSGEYEEVKDDPNEAWGWLLILAVGILGLPWTWLGYKMLQENQDGCLGALGGIMVLIFGIAQGGFIGWLILENI